jgi:hypothetical protein
MAAFVSSCVVTARADMVPVVVSGSDGGQCLAFSVGPGLLATAAHCATARHYLLSDGRKATLVRRAQFDNPYLTELERTGEDVAILDTVPDHRKERIFFARKRLNSEDRPEILLSTGERVACPLYIDQGHSFQLDCTVQDGWSGAPVVVRRWGRDMLAGLLSGRIVQGGLDTALVVPVDRVHSLLGV